MKASPLRTIVIVSTAVVLTLGSGYLFSRIRHMAGMGIDLEPMAVKLVELPDSFGSGEWTLVQTHELKEPVVKMLECKGYHYATYANSNGDTVQAVILFGPSGPIAVHTPEICFSSQAYKSLNSRRPLPLDLDGQSSSSLGALDFESKSVDGHILRVAYGWTIEGEWACPDSSRSEYAGSPYLYKVQIVMPVPAGTPLSEHNDLQEFAEEFLQFVNNELFAG